MISQNESIKKAHQYLQREIELLKEKQAALLTHAHEIEVLLKPLEKIKKNPLVSVIKTTDETWQFTSFVYLHDITDLRDPQLVELLEAYIHADEATTDDHPNNALLLREYTFKFNLCGDSTMEILIYAYTYQTATGNAACYKELVGVEHEIVEHKKYRVVCK